MTKTMTVSYHRWDYKHGGIPALTLTGLFLRDFNFGYGQRVRVVFAKNKIIITNASSKVNMLLANGE